MFHLKSMLLASALLALPFSSASASDGGSWSSASVVIAPADVEPECWIVAWWFFVKDGGLWIIELWACDDGSTFKVERPY